MNYLAHGMRFTDRPYFLAGTAVPDWLSVADRQVRMRPRRVEPFIDVQDAVTAEVAAGVMQHLDDDRWFHKTRAFLETVNDLNRLFRESLPTEDGFRPGFLGHLVTEMLLDGVLIEANPRLIDDYYAALEKIDPEFVQQAINRMARQPTTRLAQFIVLFRREGFLRDYVEPRRLLGRLNQVMRRVKLKQLPDEAETLLASGWCIVKDRAAELLPPTHFKEYRDEVRNEHAAVDGRRHRD